ncbi:MAG: hypothetical protein LBK41_07600 [Clostridiales bacterium]|jgi:hypothetical protein|nr:hypothetical protein [Clostridiales bacterium]
MEIKHITADDLRNMTGSEGLILQGCGGDPAEWANGINAEFTENGILLDGSQFTDISVFEHGGLTNIMFGMDDSIELDIGEMATWRLRTHGAFGGTWLSDYLPNILGVGVREIEYEPDEPAPLPPERGESKTRRLVDALAQVADDIRPDELDALSDRVQALDEYGRDDFFDILETLSGSVGFDALMKIAERCGGEAVMLKVEGVDLAALLLETHAVAGGGYMLDAKHSLQTLADGRDYLVMLSADMFHIIPSEMLYHRDLVGNAVWLGEREPSRVRTFAVAVDERDAGRAVGSVCEISLQSVQRSLSRYSFDFTHIDATMLDGAERVITFDEWGAMDRLDRGQIRDYSYYYNPADEDRLTAHLDALRHARLESASPASPADFLARLNESYMASAQNPQPGMIRLAREAAVEVLARGDADVFRLLPGNAAKLSPLDAVTSSGLNYSEYREFAIHRSDLPGLKKWAERACGNIQRQIHHELGERHKSPDAEL